MVVSKKMLSCGSEEISCKNIGKILQQLINLNKVKFGFNPEKETVDTVFVLKRKRVSNRE